MVTVLTVLNLSSCALLAKPSDEEIKDAMKELLPAAYEATCIVYGEGIQIEENFVIDPDWTTSHYAQGPLYRIRGEAPYGRDQGALKRGGRDLH